MKIPSTLVIVLFSLQIVNGQLREKLPAISPEVVVNQKIGNVEFEISYGRPAARGRKIFGGLVPYGEVWRTGAGPSTKLKFDKPVTIGGKLIPSGTYAVVTIPYPEKWTILLNSNTKKIFGAQQDKYETETEVVRFAVPAQATSYFYESLTFCIDIVKNNAEIVLSWENTQVHFPITTTNNEDALKTIEEFLKAEPTNVDYLSNAAYYLDVNNQAPDLVLKYANRALEIQEEWWYYELKMSTLVKMNRIDEARKTHQKAIDFIRKTKPDGWQETESHWKTITEKW
jgi:hypothetical protein